MLGVVGMLRFWHRVTYYRHRSELWALTIAMRLPLIAIFPIASILGFWWVLATLPIALPLGFLIDNLGLVGEVILAILGIPALWVLLLAAPWFFGWYGIGVSLMFGRTSAARAKERFLVEAIGTYRAKAFHSEVSAR